MRLHKDIEFFLKSINMDFDPPLSSRLSVEAYSEKISNNAIIFSVYESGNLVAFAALYCNDFSNLTAYISMLAVSQKYRGSGIGSSMLENCIRFSKKRKFKYLNLEVSKSNSNAIRLYENFGFEINGETAVTKLMCLRLENSFNEFH